MTRKNRRLIDTKAYCFYNPLSTKKLTIAELLKYMTRSLAVSDYVFIACVTLAATLLGLIAPYANRLLFGNVIASGSALQLMSVAALMAGATVSAMLIGMTKSLLMEKVNTKIDVSVKSATMSRLLSLPASFFKNYSAGEISQRLRSLNSLCDTLSELIFSAGLSSLFSLIYVGQIASLAPKLAAPALIIIAANILFAFLSSILAIKTSRRQMETSAKLSGVVFSLFSGVQKIKLAGGERRAFAKWAGMYVKNAELTFAPPLIIRLSPVISTTISMAGTIILFAVAGAAKLTVAEYMAFNVSYGLVAGAVASLAGMALTVSQVKPVLDMAKPIMDTLPEVSSDKKMLTRFRGAIEVNNVSFRYSEDMPPVLDNLSLKINPGEYIAVTGASGCGKSTLLRLLLGFEQPDKGAVYYDRHDMKSIDLKSLRRNIGCVIQNGKLISGTVLSNITFSAPWLTVKEAWEAAELAGIADDIHAMPMGMYTMISEGSGGISGGQRQRLLIARAIAPKPKLLLLDEATSALDNITQKHVAQSLDKLKCTRIVIAHRLSTIRQCGRIILMENGKIAEDGTYDELIALGGKFAELVKRQRLDG